VAVWWPDDRDALDKAIADLAGMFADAEASLQRAISVQVAAGLETGADTADTLLRISELRAAAQQVAAALRAATSEQVAAILEAATAGGVAAALDELAALGDVPALVRTTAVARGAFAAQALTLDLTSAFDDVTRRILRWPDDVYRQVIAGPTSRLLLGLGQTTRTAQAAAWQDLIRRGAPAFIDKAGRRWNSATYVEMATRTAARRAWNAQHEQTLVDNGTDLVSVVVGSDGCQSCAQWAGKVVRIGAGSTGRVVVPSAVGSGTVTVVVAGTLEQARDQGWQHPNCRCTTVAFVPGLPVVVDATTYDPELEQQREHLRYLEREVRKAKIDAAAAVTPDGRRRANTAVRDLQRRIREHVDATGLNRKRYREQVNLGRRATADAVGVPRAGSVRIPQVKGFKPGVYELKAAQRLADAGHRVELLVPSRVKGQRTPDFLVDGVRWELKSPKGSGKHNVSDQLKRGKKQSDRLIIDLARSPLDEQNFIAEVRRRIAWTPFVEVLVLTKDGRFVHVPHP